MQVFHGLKSRKQTPPHPTISFACSQHPAGRCQQGAGGCRSSSEAPVQGAAGHYAVRAGLRCHPAAWAGGGSEGTAGGTGSEPRWERQRASGSGS